MDPLVFEPFYRPQVWGGRRLQTSLGKPLPAEGTFGESWEISAQPPHPTRVIEGPLAGATLIEAATRYPADLYGARRTAPNCFPLLLKFLDCDALLSVQVHPNDALAHTLRGDEFGKTEAWVVIEAEPTARIYAGLTPGTTRADLERRLDDGTVAECLHVFTPRSGDCVFLPAGTVHTLGGGILAAEIQQSSDATFRLFDWNRLGADGRPRQLHRSEALAAIDWTAGPVRPVQDTPIRDLPREVRGENLVACPYFNLDRFTLGEPLDVPYRDQYSIWVVLESEVELASPVSKYRRTFHKGQSMLLPATAGPLRWTPSKSGALAVLLGICAPDEGETAFLRSQI